jgi:phosphoribosylformylglycinamidine synthase II
MTDFKKAGLRTDEYDFIVRTLGREPTETELRILGVMWSEHCSYKSTKPLLRTLPNKSERVWAGPGENAGIVDIGHGYGVAFKVESHNHPSAVAPYQGAATGVGGIIRDILALGARPIASMDGLFFGDPSHPRTQSLSTGIVSGVAGYGNAVGVPTVGGKTMYDGSYSDNPLLNALCLGIVRREDVISSKTARPGQLVVILGSKTGRDGIAGAAFASVELSEDSKASRPSIQIGDPFIEKLLIEACLELRDKGLIVCMQDMGAAGITSSSSEIAAKSGVGMVVDFDRVPLRAEGMQPWEIALSESQERMLLIVLPEDYDSVAHVAEHWGLDCAVIGKVTEGDRYVVRWYGEEIVSLPASLIVDDCPEAHWESRSPDYESRRVSSHAETAPTGTNHADALLEILSSPSTADKSWIYEQYDSMVQTNTIVGPGAPVSLLRIRENGNMLAVALESEPWKCRLDPFEGGAESFACGIRTVSVAGAAAIGATDCLNFPSPEKPEQYYELSEVVRGIAFCGKELQCPIVSGNVSLYNESASGAILPTPVIGVVGLIEAPLSWIPSGNWKAGDLVYLVGRPEGSLSGSRYQQTISGSVPGRPVRFDAEAERLFCSRARATARERCARSGRALAGGGLSVALVHEALASGIGASIDLPAVLDTLGTLFGEGGPRAVYAVSDRMSGTFEELWRGFPCFRIGVAGGDSLRIGELITLTLGDMGSAFRSSATISGGHN